MMGQDTALSDLLNRHVNWLNSQKPIFTPGPASLLAQNLEGLGPCFGRGDSDYEAVENAVLSQLLEMTGHQKIARMQGSGSLALEMTAMNFIYGDVLVVETGYYSDRLKLMLETSRSSLGEISEIRTIPWSEMMNSRTKADWIWACPVETSVGLRVPISDLRKLADQSGARLALDATASVGLESGHEFADVISYSSCKGLFGLTGAAFIAFNEQPRNEVNSFCLSLESHLGKKMTGPYHAIQSLSHVLPIHDDLRQSVVVNKSRFIQGYSSWLTRRPANQPLLCTQVSIPLTSKGGAAVLYSPRADQQGSVVSHLGEVHLGRQATATIIGDLQIEGACEPDSI